MTALAVLCGLGVGLGVVAIVAGIRGVDAVPPTRALGVHLGLASRRLAVALAAGVAVGGARVRVVLVVDVFPKVSTTFIAAKFVGLVDRGIDAHVVCWTSEPAMWERIATLAARPELAARVHVVPALHKPWTGIGPARARGFGFSGGRLCDSMMLLGKGLSQGQGFEAWLEALDPDLVHFEFGARAARHLKPEERFSRPVVVSFRGYDLNCVGLDRPGYYDGVWARADALHFLGDDLWQRALRRGCPSDKPHVLIPPAVDTEYFSPIGSGRPVSGNGERPLRILRVGRLHWKKGTEWALHAVRRLIDSGVAVDYRIIGDGQEAEAAAAIDDLDLAGAVTMLGSQRRPEVKDSLEWADVFVHAAVSEGFCNSVMEAQAMAVPVVTSDADGLGENVADGVTGFVVARRDPQAMADRLAALAADPGLRARMGAAGRRRVEVGFRPGDQIDAFVGLYGAVHTGELARLVSSSSAP